MKLLITLMPTVLLVVTGQLITKWRVSALQNLAAVGSSQSDRIKMYLSDPYIIGAYGLAVCSSIAWMIVVESYDISMAYPIYIGLSLGAVLLAGVTLFDEPLGPGKMIALSLIFAGVVLGAHFS